MSGKVARETAHLADQQRHRTDLEDDGAAHVDLVLVIVVQPDAPVGDLAHRAGDGEGLEERGRRTRRPRAA